MVRLLHTLRAPELSNRTESRRKNSVRDDVAAILQTSQARFPTAMDVDFYKRVDPERMADVGDQREKEVEAERRRKRLDEERNTQNPKLQERVRFMNANRITKRAGAEIRRDQMGCAQEWQDPYGVCALAH